MNEELTNDEVEIDLVDLGYVLLDKWRYLLISLIAGAVLLGAYSFFFIAPTYESTAKLYVVSASDDSVVNLSDLNLGTSLTADYEQLMLSYPVLNSNFFHIKRYYGIITINSPILQSIQNFQCIISTFLHTKYFVRKILHIQYGFVPIP